MLKRLFFLLKYFGSILLYFAIFRLIFLVYQYEQWIEKVSVKEIVLSFYHGIPLDLSFSAYIAIIPVLLIALSCIFSAQIIRPLLKGYTFLILTVLSIIQIIDLELYRNWGFKIDNSFIKYINTPNEAWASALSSPLLLLLALILLTIISAIYLFNKLIEQDFKNLPSVKIYWSLAFLFLIGLLIIPIRGGIQQIPINQSAAYYSQYNILNQAAINTPWNLMHSFTVSTKNNANPFISMDKETAQSLINDYYQAVDSTFILQTGVKKNVILIVWESFSGKVVEKLGGLKDITPRFNELCSEGMLINGMYASATRSDKGLVSLLSGYPSQGNQSIMTLPSKTKGLPSIAHSLNDEGYESSFYYGGELAFANMRSYLLNTGYKNIIGKSSFESKDMNSKWGAHDHVLFNKVLSDLKSRTSEKPHFTTIFTLSSHEPFEVPIPTQIMGSDAESKYLNSLYYTDQSIYNFIAELKKLPDYKNTVIIITGDHGHRLPGNTEIVSPETYSTPFLMLNSTSANKDIIINRICSQTDIPKILLKTLHKHQTNFPWSRNIFLPSYQQFAISTMKTGFVWTDTLGTISYDFNGNRLVYNTHPQADSVLQIGKAHLQLSFQDYLNK